MEIPLEGVLLRPWRRSDVRSLVQNANDRQVWLQLRDRFPHPYTPADARRWIRQTEAQQPQTSFAICVGGEAVGGIGLEIQQDVHRRSAEVGYWLGRRYWGRGIATRALRAVSDDAFARFDLNRLYAAVFEGNTASARVLEKAGYVLEGRLRGAVTKDGRTLDKFLYALVIP